jgi:hypothetical protein
MSYVSPPGITPWSKDAAVGKLLKNLPAFYWTRSFITTYTGVWLLVPILIQMNLAHSHLIPLELILMLSSQLRLGLASGQVPSSYPTEIL